MGSGRPCAIRQPHTINDVDAFEDRQPDIPVGNLEPATLARMLVDDFRIAWDAMASASPDSRVGGNFMFARQAFGYLELAARTASTGHDDYWLSRFGGYLADRDPRYFAPLPGAVPLPRPDEFTLPAVPTVPAERQLLAALYDMSRHGLAHIYQQTPVDLADGKQWQITFTGVTPGELPRDAGGNNRRYRHLSYTIGPVEGRVYLVLRPEVLLADLEFAARAAAIFSQYNVPEYLSRPRRGPLGPRHRSPASQQPVYDFSSDQLVAALDHAGLPQMPWPSTVVDGPAPSAEALA
jgi:hypothetical protein